MCHSLLGLCYQRSDYYSAWYLYAVTSSSEGLILLFSDLELACYSK